MVAPQTQKKVGVGGCLVSVLLFVLSVAAFFGMVVWATLGIVNSLQSAPSVALGSTGTVNIATTGTHYVFLGDLDAGGTIPSFDPDVKITDPSGSPVTVRSPSTSTSGSSGNGSFRAIGEFNAATTGAYTVQAGSEAASFSNAKIYVASFDIGDLGSKLLLALLVGGLLFLASLIVGIIWLVRRSKAKKALPPYGGGGGYPPAGGYPAQPSFPAQPNYPPQSGGPQPGGAQPGGWPQNPPPQ